MKLHIKVFICWFILLTQVPVPGKAQSKSLKEADALFNQFNYALALPAYKATLSGQKPTLYVTQRIAECYRLMNNSREAENWYNRVISFPDHDPKALKYAADAARENGNYDRAKQLYTQFGQRVPSQAALVAQLNASCDNARQWLANPEPYELQKLTNVNSTGSDFSPVLLPDGLVFTSDREVDTRKNNRVYGWTGKANYKLYYAPQRKDGRFDAPVLFDNSINNNYHNGSAIFTPDGKTIYFTRINEVKSKQKHRNNDPFSWIKFDEKNTYVNRLEVFIAQKNGENWSKPKPFSYNKVNNYSVGHPALSPDGQMLYFVSDMPGGLGETDIYYCVRQANGEWGQPVNAGNKINTSGKELFPVVSPEGVLYFSSEGHPGMGGLDILAAEGSGTKWKTIQNLKYPLNSPADDFGIAFDKTKDKGFVSSNRDSKDGTDDIYAFKIVENTCNLAGKTLERSLNAQGTFTETPVANVLVQIYFEGNATPGQTYSDAQGNFTFNIKDGQKFNLKATKSGYLIQSVDITSDCRSRVDLVKISMPLNRNTLNKPIILENIYYDFDKADVRPDAALELDKWVRTLNDNPTIRIELGSHTDSRQTETYNQRLSQLRAEAAVKYIISRGINPNRLVAKGYGETRPLNRCRDGVACSELEHQLNRRTEVKILSR